MIKTHLIKSNGRMKSTSCSRSIDNVFDFNWLKKKITFGNRILLITISTVNLGLVVFIDHYWKNTDPDKGLCRECYLPVGLVIILCCNWSLSTIDGFRWTDSEERMMMIQDYYLKIPFEHLHSSIWVRRLSRLVWNCVRIADVYE